MLRALSFVVVGLFLCSLGCADGTDFVPDAGGSDAGLLCVADSDCDDRDICNGAEACSSGRCVSGAAAETGAACDDGDACSTGDMCADGACRGTPLDCAGAGDACNAGACDPDTGACATMPVADGTVCDDADPCSNDDRCVGGSCTGDAVDCSGMSDMCNVGTCNVTSGTCEAVALIDGTACDDDSPCTADDACSAGSCGGTAVDCSAMDGNCVVGTCDETDGSCVTAVAADGALCDDGSACTEMDRCTGGACSGMGIDCSSLSDMCNVGECRAVDGSCGAVPVMDGVACDDGDAATMGDVCTGGLCAGTSVECSGFGGADSSTIPGWTERVGDFATSSERIYTGTGSSGYRNVATRDGSIQTDGCGRMSTAYGSGSGVRSLGIVLRWTVGGSYIVAVIQDNSGGSSAQFDSMWIYEYIGPTQRHLAGGMSIALGTSPDVRASVTGTSVLLQADVTGDGVFDADMTAMTSIVGAGLTGLMGYTTGGTPAYMDDFCWGCD